MITGGQDSSDQILKQLEDAPLQREIQPGIVVNLEDPNEYGMCLGVAWWVGLDYCSMCVYVCMYVYVYIH